jgi:hypothetical protein
MTLRIKSGTAFRNYEWWCYREIITLTVKESNGGMRKLYCFVAACSGECFSSSGFLYFPRPQPSAFHNIRNGAVSLTDWLTRGSKLKVTLRLTVNQSVCLGVDQTSYSIPNLKAVRCGYWTASHGIPPCAIFSKFSNYVYILSALNNLSVND